MSGSRRSAGSSPSRSPARATGRRKTRAKRSETPAPGPEGAGSPFKRNQFGDTVGGECTRCSNGTKQKHAWLVPLAREEWYLPAPVVVAQGGSATHPRHEPVLSICALAVYASQLAAGRSQPEAPGPTLGAFLVCGPPISPETSPVV